MQLNFVLNFLRHVPSFFVAKFEKLIARICYGWQKKNSKKWLRQTTFSGVLYVEKCISSNQLISRRNLNSYFFFIKANVFDAATIFVHLLLDSSNWSNYVLLKILLVVKEKTYVYGPSRALGKKALAICVQSYCSSSTCVMLLSFSRHVYVAILKFSFWFLLLSNFLVRENPS